MISFPDAVEYISKRFNLVNPDIYAIVCNAAQGLVEAENHVEPEAVQKEETNEREQRAGTNDRTKPKRRGGPRKA